MRITPAFPDIRSDDVEASRAFYSGLLGFDVSMEAGKFSSFTSPSEPNIQVSLNGDFDSLPAGFIVDVGTGERVQEIHDAARETGPARVIEAMDNKPWGIRPLLAARPERIQGHRLGPHRAAEVSGGADAVVIGAGIIGLTFPRYVPRSPVPPRAS